ncbi:TrbI/VirB10 family protein [Hyphomicrobium sp. CS1BSMeth3]|uniref:TrbI/VirB10 family protein n=1 Tax=Hyphomicrobium sp. CS1BSMeth3 TaxID=1892844 RepID=UPI0009307B91|nr:TrbI/VirB10 family protein [Hyphomicrobium sp. CS1BSMeth3]
MTDTVNNEEKKIGNTERQEPKPAESLELRAKPAPITRINRKVLFAVAGLVLLFLSGLIIVALNPPRFASRSPSELFNVEQKVTPEGLSKLPATYEGVRSPQPMPRAEQRIPPSDTRPTNPFDEAPRGFDDAERARQAKRDVEARESPLFFRLQLKAPSRAADRSVPLPVADSKGEGAAVTRTDGPALNALRRSLGNEDVSTDATEATRKLTFLKEGPEAAIYNRHALQTPVSPYQLMAGSVISASLVTGLNSDLPGFVIAQVTEHVYDTATGRYLLIPQGTRLVGKYDNVVAFGQERALVVWQRLILPDGSSIVIDNLPATDTGGYAGLADEVDLHTWRLLKGIALATVLGVSSELAFGGIGGSGDSDLVRALQLSTQSTTNRAGQRLVERNLNVQPTVTVRPGWPLRVIVHKDLVLRPYRGPGITTH